MTAKIPLTLCAAAILACAAMTTTAQAGPRGKVVDRSVERGTGFANSRTTFQTRRGQAVQTTNRSFDQSTGTGQRSRTVTTATGATASQARQFQRTFVLAEGIEIIGAELDNGLLHVDLERPMIEPKVRNIEIVSSSGQSRSTTIESTTADKPRRAAVARSKD